MLPCIVCIPLCSSNGCQIWSAGTSIKFKNKRPLVLQYAICANVSGSNEIWTVTYLISPLPTPNREVHITHPLMISRFPQTDICSCFHCRFSVAPLTCVRSVHKGSILKTFSDVHIHPRWFRVPNPGYLFDCRSTDYTKWPTSRTMV
jgi:hypothetical protein